MAVKKQPKNTNLASMKTSGKASDRPVKKINKTTAAVAAEKKAETTQRISVNDSKERAQYEQHHRGLEAERKAMLEKKFVKKKMKKYRLFRFSNILLWLAVIGTVVGGFYVYQKYVVISDNPYGERTTELPNLAQSAYDTVNTKYKDAAGKSAVLKQAGPTVNLFVKVPEGTSTSDAKQFADDVITEFVTALGDARNEGAHYGQTFMKYEMNIEISQTNLKSPEQAELDKVGNPDGESNKVDYPLFGTIKKGALSWANNNK